LRLGRAALCALVFAAVLGGPARVLAQQQKGEAREVHARELFVLGNYAAALEIYAKLYAETAHPTYLRNVGRCYQNLGEADKAIASFREYLRQVKGLSADERGVVEQYIREMEGLKEKQQAAASAHAQAVAQPPPAQPPPATDSRTAPAPPPMLSADAGEKSHKDVDGRSRRTTSYVVGGLSLGVLGVGAFFGFRALSNQRDSDALCSMNLCRGNGVALSQDAKTNARVADVAVGAGLVGAGVAAYLFLSSASDERAAKPRAGDVARLHLLPELGPNRAGLMADLAW
jgi:tetratricopeptide (TPR) repeat protein